MSPEPPDVIMTSIIQKLIGKLDRTHQRRRISVFSGPPGIGKTTALKAFAAANEGQIIRVTIPKGSKGGATPTLVLQRVNEALEGLNGGLRRERRPTCRAELSACLFDNVCAWAEVRPSDAWRDGIDPAHVSPLTILIDEAQNLSPAAIEELRFTDDPANAYSPFPLGMAFVGNNEFVLSANNRGDSMLSEAFADRALYVEAFDYKDVRDDDLSLFFDALGISDPATLRLLLGYFRASHARGSRRVNRSFRRVYDLAVELIEAAAGGSVTAEITREVLSLT